MFKITMHYQPIYIYNGERGYYLFSATEKYLVCGSIEGDIYHKMMRIR